MKAYLGGLLIRQSPYSLDLLDLGGRNGQLCGAPAPFLLAGATALISCFGACTL